MTSANRSEFRFLRTLTTWHCPPAVQQSFDISCSTGPTTATCRSGFAAVGPCRWAHRRTDTVPLHRTGSTYYAGSANNCYFFQLTFAHYCEEVSTLHVWNKAIILCISSNRLTCVIIISHSCVHLMYPGSNHTAAGCVYRDSCCSIQLWAIFGGLTVQVNWLGLRVGGHPALSLHSSNEPGELSHCRGYYYYYLHTIIGLTQKTTHGAKSKKLFFSDHTAPTVRLGNKIIRPVQIVIQIFPKVFIMKQVE